MRFVVSPEVFARLPGMRLVVAVAAGVDNSGPRPEAAARWQAAWERAGTLGVANAQSHPRVQPWRERFRAMGVSGREFPASIEALLRRALRGGAPFSIHPLVDFYNSVSLTHIVPAGGFDLDDIRGPLELRLTRAGDTFTALDGEAPADVALGEVAYADGTTVLTRHIVWRQSRVGLIRPESRRVFLVSEVLGELPDGVAEAVRADFAAGLAALFGVEAQTWVLDQAQPEVAWELTL